MKGVFSKPSGNMKVVPIFVFRIKDCEKNLKRESPVLITGMGLQCVFVCFKLLSFLPEAF